MMQKPEREDWLSKIDAALAALKRDVSTTSHGLRSSEEDRSGDGEDGNRRATQR